MPVFDAHLHIIDPRYPLVENQGYLPKDFLVEDYLQRASTLTIQSGVVVSGSFQVFDQTYLVNALKQLNINANNFVGVTQLPANVSDDEIVTLDRQGVRALRFNLKRGGSESVAELESMANRVFELVGWHVELYIGFDALSELSNVIGKLPSVSIDHLGLEARSLPILKDLVSVGVNVKATGFGRLDFDFLPTIRAIYAINPDALMFGTDLPSTRAPKPFDAAHLRLLEESFDESVFKKITWQNGRSFYRLN